MACVSLERIGRLSDEDVVAHLVQVRGIGRWTAEMFLLATLGRLDVWPVGDYGVRAGFAAYKDCPRFRHRPSCLTSASPTGPTAASWPGTAGRWWTTPILFPRPEYHDLGTNSVAQRRGILMARSAMMFFCTSVVPAPMDV